jgi:methylated-DNA-[protein]-cysteine S-methyltransferase
MAPSSSQPVAAHPQLTATTILSPLGPIHLVASTLGLCAVGFADRWDGLRAAVGARFGTPAIIHGDVADAPVLAAYFAGDREAIASLAVDPGGTAFQQRVWSALRRIPCGKTASYSDIARAIEAPTAVRAVGAANGNNPVAIVVPCHRVIGASGKLTGYSAGLDRKRWLLSHEGALPPTLAG